MKQAGASVQGPLINIGEGSSGQLSAAVHHSLTVSCINRILIEVSITQARNQGP